MENISQSKIEVLDKGLEIVLIRYNEELKKSNSFNKRAMYPISIMPIISTILIFLLKFLKMKTDTNLLFIVLIIFLLYAIIYGHFIIITIPRKVKLESASSPKYFYEHLNKANSIAEYYKILIQQYEKDYQTLCKKNEKKGNYLKYMYLLFSITILLYMLILGLYSYYIL